MPSESAVKALFSKASRVPLCITTSRCRWRNPELGIRTWNARPKRMPRQPTGRRSRIPSRAKSANRRARSSNPEGRRAIPERVATSTCAPLLRRPRPVAISAWVRDPHQRLPWIRRRSAVPRAGRIIAVMLAMATTCRRKDVDSGPDTPVAADREPAG